MSRLKDIPELQRDGKNIKAVCDSIREAMQTFRGYRGDPLDEAITLRTAVKLDMVNANLVAIYAGVGVGTVLGGSSGSGSAYVPDSTPPPTPSGLSVSAGITSLYVEQDTPAYTTGHGHDRTVVYGAKWPLDDVTAPTFSEAVHLFDFQGDFGAYVSDPSTRWCIWIKWRSMDGVESSAPAGGTNGAQATTAVDVSTLVAAMTGPGNPFKIVSSPITLPDGSIVPAGTYTADAFIHNGFITNAKIANLAVTDAKIVTLGVGKLTAGSIDVGAYIQSPGYTPGSFGWRINGDGTAELAQVVVRGTIFASAGAIGGSNIGSNYIRSTTYALGSTGWNLNSDGTGQLGGMTLASNYLQSFNYIAGTSGWRISGSGALEMNGGTFRGALSAASGSFTGAVNTGNFTGYGWPAAGGTGAHISSLGLLLGNITPSAGNPLGKYFQVSTPVGGVPSITTNIPAYLEDLQVTTLKIAGQAVTIPSGAYTAGAVTMSPSGAVGAQSLTYVSTGAPVVITFTGMVNVIEPSNTTATGTISLQVYRNGSLIAAPVVIQYATADNSLFLRGQPVVFSIIDTPSAGTVTYATNMSASPLGGNISHRSLTALELKR